MSVCVPGRLADNPSEAMLNIWSFKYRGLAKMLGSQCPNRQSCRSSQIAFGCFFYYYYESTIKCRTLNTLRMCVKVHAILFSHNMIKCTYVLLVKVHTNVQIVRKRYTHMYNCMLADKNTRLLRGKQETPFATNGFRENAILIH